MYKADRKKKTAKNKANFFDSIHERYIPIQQV